MFFRRPSVSPRIHWAYNTTSDKRLVCDFATDMCDDSKRLLQKSTNGLGGRQAPVGGHATTAYNVGVPLEQSMDIINQQCQEIYDLRTQLNLVMNERDMLLSEVGRLKFNMELYDQRMMAHDTSR